jgi:hypothetical protein
MTRWFIILLLLGVLAWVLFGKKESYDTQDLKEYLKTASKNPAATSAVLGDPALIKMMSENSADLGQRLKSNTMKDFPDYDVSAMQSILETYLKSKTPTPVS